MTFLTPKNHSQVDICFHNNIEVFSKVLICISFQLTLLAYHFYFEVQQSALPLHNLKLEEIYITIESRIYIHL